MFESSRMQEMEWHRLFWSNTVSLEKLTGVRNILASIALCAAEGASVPSAIKQSVMNTDARTMDVRESKRT